MPSSIGCGLHCGPAGHCQEAAGSAKACQAQRNPRQVLPYKKLEADFGLVLQAVARKLQGYPERAQRNMHHARCRVPAAVAHILRLEPQLVAPAVEAFYVRDATGMKAATRMACFPPKVNLLGLLSNSSLLLQTVIHSSIKVSTHCSHEGHGKTMAEPTPGNAECSSKPSLRRLPLKGHVAWLPFLLEPGSRSFLQLKKMTPLFRSNAKSDAFLPGFKGHPLAAGIRLSIITYGVG